MIEQLTGEERANIYGDLRVVAKALRILDAQAAELAKPFVSRVEYDRMARQRDIMRNALNSAISAMKTARRAFNDCNEAHLTDYDIDAEAFLDNEIAALTKALAEARK